MSRSWLFMFYLIGLGLGDEKDISLKGLEAIKSSSRIYLEHYTSLLGVDKEKLSDLYGKEVILADREMVESEADRLFENSKSENVSFLVVGDPFGATTHTDIVLRAKSQGIEVKIIHNASIMNAIGCIGLALYSYGVSVSIVFFTETWKPDSWYSKVADNRSRGLHTLCLLDIKVKEPSLESLARGRPEYEPPRFMTISQAIEQLLEIEKLRGENVINENTVAVGLARVGQDDQLIVSGTLSELLEVDFGKPLHSLVIPGRMHFLEADFLKTYALNPQTFDQYSEIQN